MILLGPYLMASALLVVAGAAKAARPADSGRALRQGLGGPTVPVWTVLVRVGALVEAALGVAGIVRPSTPVAAAIAASYAAFTAFVLLARANGGPLATCGCFGTPDTPPTLGHAMVDVLAACSAAVVAGAGPDAPIGRILAGQADHGVPLVAGAVAATWLAVLVLVPLARLQALRALDPPPPVVGPPAPTGATR